MPLPYCRLQGGTQRASGRRVVYLALHLRRSLRLRAYDYTRPGAYFVTVCTHDRLCLFGEIVGGVMHATDYGNVVHEEWFKGTATRSNVVLEADEWIVMPNHVHGIIQIVGEVDVVGIDGVGARRRCAPTVPTGERFGNPVSGSIPTIVRAFKSATARRISLLRRTPSVAVWQRNYYEHVIRDEAAHFRLRQYIANNPMRWAEDHENPNRAR